MTTVINIHKDSFMFMTGVMSCLWQCHVSLMHTSSNKVLPNSNFAKYPALCKRGLCILKSPLIWNVFWYLLDIIVLLAHASVFQCRSIKFDCSGTIVVWDYTYIIQHNQSIQLKSLSLTSQDLTNTHTQIWFALKLHLEKSNCTHIFRNPHDLRNHSCLRNTKTLQDSKKYNTYDSGFGEHHLKKKQQLEEQTLTVKYKNVWNDWLSKRHWLNSCECKASKMTTGIFHRIQQCPFRDVLNCSCLFKKKCIKII